MREGIQNNFSLAGLAPGADFGSEKASMAKLLGNEDSENHGRKRRGTDQPRSAASLRLPLNYLAASRTKIIAVLEAFIARHADR